MLKKDKFGKMCKEKMIAELTSSLDEHPNFILTSYMGSSVNDLEQVRKNLKPASASYMVVKNSILRIILDDRKMDSLKPMVDGGVGISFSGDDIVATCKALVNFSKDHDKFKIKGAMVDGKLLMAEDIKVLASLPSREVLLARVVGGMKSPINGFVNTLGGIIRKFVYVVDAIKNGKQNVAEGAKPAASA